MRGSFREKLIFYENVLTGEPISLVTVHLKRLTQWKDYERFVSRPLKQKINKDSTLYTYFPKRLLWDLVNSLKRRIQCNALLE